MKMEDYTQIVAATPRPLAGRVEPTDSHTEPAAKAQFKTDNVKLSGFSPVATDRRDLELSRGQRVEELKSSVASGAYQVPGRAVAEKMLSKLVAGGTTH